MRRLALVVLTATIAAGCATRSDVRDALSRYRSSLAKTEAASAECAPKAVAYARAELALAERASERGEGVLAAGALEDAERWVNAATAPEMLAPCEVVKPGPQPVSDPNGDVVQRSDMDGDGVEDRLDACPTEPEDIDGYLDEDGCPDLDNDGDGISDAVDQCPIEPEDIDGVEDIDGCPERH